MTRVLSTMNGQVEDPLVRLWGYGDAHNTEPLSSLAAICSRILDSEMSDSGRSLIAGPSSHSEVVDQHTTATASSHSEDTNQHAIATQSAYPDVVNTCNIPLMQQSGVCVIDQSALQESSGHVEVELIVIPTHKLVTLNNILKDSTNEKLLTKPERQPKKPLPQRIARDMPRSPADKAKYADVHKTHTARKGKRVWNINIKYMELNLGRVSHEQLVADLRTLGIESSGQQLKAILIMMHVAELDGIIHMHRSEGGSDGKLQSFQVVPDRSDDFRARLVELFRLKDNLQPNSTGTRTVNSAFTRLGFRPNARKFEHHVWTRAYRGEIPFVVL